MSIIVAIEEALKDRLAADIQGLAALEKVMAKPDGSQVTVPIRIESYPKQPSEQILLALASSGAVVVRYTGSGYSPRRDVGTVSVQDRTMRYEVLVFSDTLQARDTGSGIYQLLDLVALRLIGHKPAGCVDGIELERDDYVEERKGSWTYGILITLKTQIQGVV
jgi:hypothetical protein